MVMRSYGSYLRIMDMCEGGNCQFLHINGSNVKIDDLSNTVVPEQSGSYYANEILDCISVIENHILFNTKLMKCVLGQRINNKSILVAWNRPESMLGYIFMHIICWSSEKLDSFYKQPSCKPIFETRQ